MAFSPQLSISLVPFWMEQICGKINVSEMTRLDALWKHALGMGSSAYWIKWSALIFMMIVRSKVYNDIDNLFIFWMNRTWN